MRSFFILILFFFVTPAEAMRYKRPSIAELRDQMLVAQIEYRSAKEALKLFRERENKLKNEHKAAKAGFKNEKNRELLDTMIGIKYKLLEAKMESGRAQDKVLETREIYYDTRFRLLWARISFRSKE
ncbi:MAG: hypothetical protein ABIA47_00235 [bacterium]